MTLAFWCISWRPRWCSLPRAFFPHVGCGRPLWMRRVFLHLETPGPWFAACPTCFLKAEHSSAASLRGMGDLWES